MTEGQGCQALPFFYLPLLIPQCAKPQGVWGTESPMETTRS
jgi:hypothetical protein